MINSSSLFPTQKLFDYAIIPPPPNRLLMDGEQHIQEKTKTTFHINLFFLFPFLFPLLPIFFFKVSHVGTKIQINLAIKC